MLRILPETTNLLRSHRRGSTRLFVAGRLFVVTPRLHPRPALVTDRNVKVDRLAADLTVFDVLLVTHRAVNHQIDSLAAVWAGDAGRLKETHRNFDLAAFFSVPATCCGRSGPGTQPASAGPVIPGLELDSVGCRDMATWNGGRYSDARTNNNTDRSRKPAHFQTAYATPHMDVPWSARRPRAIGPGR